MKITDEYIADEFLYNNKNIDPKSAFLAGLIYERRASARLALSVNDAMAHAIGKLIRSRSRDINRHRYE